MAAGDKVNVLEGYRPTDYHCSCNYCLKIIGELRAPDHSYYSRLERRQYYDKSESGKGGHIAKTPLHLARWLIQKYTKPGDWVLDPTIGAGTTAVEALTQGRNVAGMELQFGSVLKANIEKALAISSDVQPVIKTGDARNIGRFLDELDVKFSLVVSNPPYSGDEHAGNVAGKKTWTTHYKSNLPNLAFLDEGPAYWEALDGIYKACVDHLKPGGYFATGVKDMMRRKQPFMLHKDLCELLSTYNDMNFVGTAFLKHYPTTLFLNTYEKRYGVRPPLYQTISVWRKED